MKPTIGLLYLVASCVDPSEKGAHDTARPADSAIGHDSSPPDDSEAPGESADSGDSGPDDSAIDTAPDPTGEAPPRITWGTTLTVADAGASAVGEALGDQAGACLLSPGDTDGDGVDDLLFGAPHNSEGALDGGKIYRMPGGASGWSDGAPVAALGSVVGDVADLELCLMGSLGDANGDGLPDVAFNPGYQSGPAESIYGMWTGASWGASLPASEADFIAFDRGVSSDETHELLDTRGDADGDGLGELFLAGGAGDHEAILVSATALGPITELPDSALLRLYSRAEALHFRPAGDATGDGVPDLIAYDDAADDWWLVPVEPGAGSDQALEDLPTARFAEAADFQSVSSLGDVNLDGIDDLWVRVEPGDTARYGVVFGRAAWPADLEAADLDVVALSGATVSDAAWLHDLNGDGQGDLALTVLDEAGTTCDVLLFFGRESWPSELSPSDADVVIAGDSLGSCLQLPGAQQQGDLNGDGIGELLLYAEETVDGHRDAGMLLIYAGDGAWPGALTVADADLSLVGETPNQRMGYGQWTAVGDYDGDGYDDLALASAYHPLADPTNGVKEGQIFFFFGAPGP